jgi:hypothetical protein
MKTAFAGTGFTKIHAQDAVRFLVDQAAGIQVKPAIALTHPRLFSHPNSGERRKKKQDFGDFPPLPVLGNEIGESVTHR